MLVLNIFLINSEFLVRYLVGNRLKTPLTLRISIFKLLIKFFHTMKNRAKNEITKTKNIILLAEV